MSAPADRGPAGTAGAHVRSLCVNARHSGLDDSSAWSATVTEQARVFVCTRPGARRVYVLTVNLAEAVYVIGATGATSSLAERAGAVRLSVSLIPVSLVPNVAVMCWQHFRGHSMGECVLGASRWGGLWWKGVAGRLVLWRNCVFHFILRRVYAGSKVAPSF